MDIPNNVSDLLKAAGTTRERTMRRRPYTQEELARTNAEADRIRDRIEAIIAEEIRAAYGEAVVMGNGQGMEAIIKGVAMGLAGACAQFVGGIRYCGTSGLLEAAHEALEWVAVPVQKGVSFGIAFAAPHTSLGEEKPE